MTPIPETRSALLVRGSGPPRVTRHNYVRTEVGRYRPRPIDIVEEAPTLAHFFVFACEETGVERRWGYELIVPAVPAGGAS